MTDTTKPSAAAELRDMAGRLLDSVAALEQCGADAKAIATMLEQAGRTYVAAAKAMRRDGRG